VLADSVNSLNVTRDAWKHTADAAAATLYEVEVICSDQDVHRHRVETRKTNIPGLTLPTWDQVTSREYHPWHRDHIILDTAHKNVFECVHELIAAIG
jgi:hypothetical protein